MKEQEERGAALPWIVSERHTVEGGEVVRNAGASWICRKPLAWSHHTIHHGHSYKHGIPCTVQKNNHS